MLVRLKINNYAIINEIEIDFTKGLNIITGETGAGKSILLGALGLILGNRADNSILNQAAKKCIIEGHFDLSHFDIGEFFTEYDLDHSDLTIIRREISPNGNSRSFINDTPVLLSTLKIFSEQFIDIHSQNQTLLLNDQKFQLGILDSVSGNEKLLSEYKKLFTQYSTLKTRLSESEESENRSRKDLDYLVFQYNELNKADLHENEDKELEEEYQTLSHAEKIKANLLTCYSGLYENEFSIFNTLNELVKRLNEISDYHPRLNAFLQRVTSLRTEIQDIAGEFRNFENSTELDEGRLNFINERLNLINQLLNKHKFRNIGELLEYSERLRGDISKISSLEEQISKLKKEIDGIYSRLIEISEELSRFRISNIPAIEKKLTSLLKELGIKNAEIKFELSQYPLSELKATGKDKLNILFTSNPGMPLQPLNRIASGGELSRLMLAIKSVLADSSLLPTLIFDEIDLGISGEIAINVGQLLKKLSEKHQVINISHLPQVASMGNSHFMVYKVIEDNNTQTLIRQLSGKERILEIAKMIGGNHPTEANIESSKELINHFNGS